MERADEVRTLSFNATSDVTEPIEQHATQQVEQARAVLEKTGGQAAGDVLQG
ncbi:MAG: hypothetical protein WA884_14380 [Methyloceanibacter sp.]